MMTESEAAALVQRAEQRQRRTRPIEQLRVVLSTLCHFVWTKQLRPGEHLWTIPVDQERDFDCILADGIDELEELRARVEQLQQAQANLEQLANARAFSADEARQQHAEELARWKALLQAQAARVQALEQQAERLRHGLRVAHSDFHHIARLAPSAANVATTFANAAEQAMFEADELATLTQPGAAPQEIKK